MIADEAARSGVYRAGGSDIQCRPCVFIAPIAAHAGIGAVQMMEGCPRVLKKIVLVPHPTHATQGRSRASKPRLPRRRHFLRSASHLASSAWSPGWRMFLQHSAKLSETQPGETRVAETPPSSGRAHRCFTSRSSAWTVSLNHPNAHAQMHIQIASRRVGGISGQ